MPFTNTTHTSASQTPSNYPEPSGAAHASSYASSNPVVAQNYAGELYYGVGRFLRSKWDYLYETFWKDSGSSAEAIARKQRDIYVAGLKECIEHLKPALENVRKNPNDPASLRKIDDLAQHYAAYVNFASTMELNVYQQQLFQPIRKQVEQLSDPSLKQKLKMLLPVLSMGSSAQENKKMGSLVQDDEYSLLLSKSYYDEESTFKKSSESSSKEKRSIEQILFPAVFNLRTLDGSNGFSVPGIASNGQLGSFVSTAGDVNGDNISDFVLGAPSVNSNNGASYVIFGSRSGFPAVFNLSTLTGNNGFSVPGITSAGYLGYSVSTAGDVNGDNITDLVLGANSANSNNGASYVIFGSRSGFPAVFNLNSLNGSNGFSIPGVISGQLGWSVSTAGDVNGDAITDLVLGAPSVNFGNGASYVIFGSRSGFPAVFSLNSLNGSNGFVVRAITASNGQLGNSVSTAGDINGDNIADLVLGAPFINSGNGISYVIFGSRSGFPTVFNLSTLDGSNGFSIPGIASAGRLGRSVSAAGDVNGDSVSDLILGATQANSLSGTSYVIFGSRSGFPAVFNLSTLNGSNGFSIPGIASAGYLGVSVSIAGDVNGDNITDLVLGASEANSTVGVSYTIFGSRSGFPAMFNLSTLNGSNGFSVPGIVSGGGLGISVSTAGDINGDNITDLVLGAYTANAATGTAYVLFGQSLPTPPPTPTPTPTLTPIITTAASSTGAGSTITSTTSAMTTSTSSGTTATTTSSQSTTATPVQTTATTTSTTGTSTASSSSSTTTRTPTPSPRVNSAARLEPFWLSPVKFLSATSQSVFNTLMGFEKERPAIDKGDNEEKEKVLKGYEVKTFFAASLTPLRASTNGSELNSSHSLPMPN